MPNIEIYTTRFCPYCTRAKHLLEHKGVSFKEYAVDKTAGLRKEMIKRSNGSHTVPQIFINDKHIGGCDDLFALERNDKLDPLLTQ